MTTLLLIRHARHDLLGKVLAGRAPGLHLNSEGRREAKELVGRLREIPFSAIYSSPLERARETAGPLANDRGLAVRVSEGFNEMGFGEWTSLSFADLGERAEWKLWNAARSQARPPGGETIGAVFIRTAAELDRLSIAHPEDVVVVFSHADVIKAAVMSSLGISIDYHMRLEISPASITVIQSQAGFRKVVALNCPGELPAAMCPGPA
jgi:probable phosphoglycerate mutase